MPSPAPSIVDESLKTPVPAYTHTDLNVDTTIFAAYDPTFRNVLTFFPPDWGMLRRSRCILIFLKKLGDAQKV